MNYTKFAFWLSMCAIVGMGQTLVGKDYIFYYDREPTELEDIVYSAIGKSYSVESDFIDEQSPSKTDFRNIPQGSSNIAAEDQNSSRIQSSETQYAPAINDLPYADAQSPSHKSVEIRALPQPVKDNSFNESEYEHAEYGFRYAPEINTDRYQHAAAQNNTASQEIRPSYHLPTPKEYQSGISLNPVPGEFYYTSNEEEAPSAAPEKTPSKATPEQIPSSSQQLDSLKKQNSNSTPNTNVAALDHPIQNEQPVEPKQNDTESTPRRNIKNESAQPKIAMAEKPAALNAEATIDARNEKDPDLVAYADELNHRLPGPPPGPERLLSNFDEGNEQFENICFENDCCWSWCIPDFCLYVGNVVGKGVGYRTGYTSLGLWTSFNSMCDCFRPFVDIRGHVFNNGEKAANVGLGGRYCCSCLDVIFGGNIYYDYRQGRFSDYNQIGIGAEILGACWDFRINGYIPVGRREGCKCKIFDDFEGDFFASCFRQERSLAGFDAELGSYLKRRNPCNCCDFDLYAAIGPYYYSRPHDWGRTVFGGQVRLAASWMDCLTAEVIATSDHVYHTRVQGRFEINIPLGAGWCFWECNKNNDCGNCSCCWPRCVDCLRVWRREIIVLDNHCEWITNFHNSCDDGCGCNSGGDSDVFVESSGQESSFHESGFRVSGGSDFFSGSRFSR